MALRLISSSGKLYISPSTCASLFCGVALRRWVEMPEDLRLGAAVTGVAVSPYSASFSCSTSSGDGKYWGFADNGSASVVANRVACEAQGSVETLGTTIR